MKTLRHFISALSIALLLICNPTSATAEAYTTLTNPDGDQIEAVILDAYSGRVRIRVKGTDREMLVEKIMFSEQSRKLIEEWETKRAIAKSLDFGFSTKRFSFEKQDSASRVWTDSLEGYTVRVGNGSEVAVPGITAKYVIVVRSEDMGRRKASDYRLETLTGNLTFTPIPPKGQVRVETVGAPLREEKLKPGYFLTGGGEEKAQDKLEGIIVEFYHNGNLIKKDSSNSRLESMFTMDGKATGR